MQKPTAIASAILTSLSVLVLTTSEVSAAVKFRVGFDTTDNTYGVYMTPDSTPERDMLIAAQVTLVVPNDSSGKFTTDNIQSLVPGAIWVPASRVNAPPENASSDYISLAYSFTGSTAPSFNWVPDEEQKIFSFTSATGCDTRVKLIDNKDAFSQLPNSAQTNPGNDFLNVGWAMSNAYIGSYGDAITCPVVTVVETVASSCEPTSQDQYYLKRIARLEALRDSNAEYLHNRFNLAINNLKARLSCEN